MRFRALTGDAKEILGEGIWHGRLARVHAHWRSLAAEGALPDYGQLQLASLAPDLRFLATLRVDGPEFLFVSIGEEIAERYGPSMVGSFLADQFVGPTQLDVVAAHRACVDQRVPIVSEVTLSEVDLSSRVPFQRLLLPFAKADGAVDHILWVMAFPA